MGKYAKAIAAGIGAAATYLIGVIPAEGSFEAVNTVQWLGLVPVVLAVYGVTWAVPNQTE
jgi:multidrug transporter EmrE-like cation transporter